MMPTDHFAQQLMHFRAAAAINDGPAFAALFTETGSYDDGFFGIHTGRAAIAGMLNRFHESGRDFSWDFFEPVCDGVRGYARYRFCYRSTLPEAAGKPVAFEGMSRFLFEGDLIADYSEVFDRGIAFSQLGFASERIAKLLSRFAATQNAKAPFQGRLAK